jgi:hypothetical protein
VPQKPQRVVPRQTVTLSRKPENLLGSYRLLPSIVTTAPSIPVYGMLRGPDSGCLAGHPLAASACGTKASHDGGPCIGIAHEIGQCAEH